ncbi:Kelch repeat-containing protein [Bacillus amyloliquefaciens]|uniref:Kelch repeat-containing protein n=1 Tax=Bacillus amyloliquefaciens TaxID=1390 RepID=UPI001D0462FE|nr:kelch repeat-containing protein [Bacillus amyloliquefaciens]
MNKLAEKYDKWTRLLDMIEPNYAFESAVVGNSIYVLGGARNQKYNKNYSFDTISQKWMQGLDMPTPRVGSCTAVIGNCIYVFGGYNGATVYKSVDVYDTETNTWGSAPDIPTPTCHASAAVINDTIYLIGGFDTDAAHSQHYAFDTLSQTWSVKKAPPINIYATETEVFNGKSYLIGGQTKEVVQGHIRSNLNEFIYEYDPVLDRWSRKKFLGPLQNTSTAVLNNKIYIIGGRKNPSVIEPLTKVYDPIKDEISVENPYPFERYDARIAAVGDNLYLFGGLTPSGLALEYLHAITPVKTEEDKGGEPKNPEEPPNKQPAKNRAILLVTMTTGLEKEFDLSMEEIKDFIRWYDQKSSGIGVSRYVIEKHNNNIGPFENRRDHIVFGNILTFNVSEYTTDNK